MHEEPSLLGSVHENESAKLRVASVFLVLFRLRSITGKAETGRGGLT